MLLTDEEISQLEENCIDCGGRDEKEVAKAQLKKDLQYMIDNGVDKFIEACCSDLGEVHIPKVEGV